MAAGPKIPTKQMPPTKEVPVPQHKQMAGQGKK